MKRRYFVVLLGVFFMSALHADAAMLYMDPTTAELNRGDTLKLSVRLDTDDEECVNVVDAVISYSENIQAVDVSRGASIMSMWVEEPVIDQSNHTITFAGGIPNGYCGRIAGDPRLTNVVVDLLFQSPGFVIGANSDNSQAKIAFTDQTQVLLNDGFGTQAPLTLFGAVINLTKNAGSSVQNQWGDIVNADTIPPERFSISLDRTTNAYSNRYFIAFNTTDKQSGVDHYEVIEESMAEAQLFNWGREDAPWREVKSPYVLKDQTLNSTIRVRAIDKAGNEYVATLVPEEAQRTATLQAKILLTAIITIVLLFVTAGFVYIVVHVRRKRRTAQEEAINESSV